MSNIDWDNAPGKASCYGGGHFWMYCYRYKQWMFWDGKKWEADWTGVLPMNCADYCTRPQTKQNEPEITQGSSNKYSRQIVGLDGKTCQIDVYRVLAAFEVDSHPVAHAIKKLLAPGKRHAKTREQDLREAIASIEAELLMMEQAE